MAEGTEAPDEPARNQRLILTALVCAAALGADLWSKAWAWDALREGQSIELVADWAYLEFGFNTGSAFSLLRDFQWARHFFIVVTLGALVYMGRLAWTLPTRWSTGFVAVGLIASGALGNLHDRLFRIMEIGGEMKHGVVDFIKVFYWPARPWPTFNVADVALVVGVGMLILYISRHGEELDARTVEAENEAEPQPA